MTSSVHNQNDLQIGQVLYIVSDKQTRVIPVVVSEQAITRTLEGNSTTWKVIIGPKEKRKTYDLKSITGEKFFTLEEAKQSLLSRFNEFLNQTIQESEKTCKTWYGIELNSIQTKQEQKTPNAIPENFDPDSILESIDSNENDVVESTTSTSQTTKASDFLLSVEKAQKLTADDTPETRRAKLKAMISVGDSEDSNESSLRTPSSQKAIKIHLPDALGGGEVTVDS